jgi:hypothetical protein
MSIPKYLIAKGSKFNLYEILNNDDPQLEGFIDELSKGDKAKTYRLLRRIADCGPPKNIQKFKNEGNGIFAIKPTSQVRIYCFFDKGKLILMNYPAASYGVSKTSIRNRPFAASCGELTRMRLTNFVIKQSEKADPNALKKAEQIKDKYFEPIKIQGRGKR